VTTTVSVAASAFAEVLPKTSRTRLAVDPFSFRCVTSRFENALASFADRWKYATTTRSVGSTDRHEYTVAAQPEFRLASK
jgi:hypothetical protein